MHDLDRPERLHRIRNLENEILRLLRCVDLTPDTGERLKLWWQIEEFRFDLETLCGQDVPSELLRSRKSASR